MASFNVTVLHLSHESHFHNSHLNFLSLMFRNRFLPHPHHLQLNPLRNRKNRNFPEITPLYPRPICLGIQI